MEELAEKIYQYFIENEYYWRIDEELVIPEQRNIEVMLNGMLNAVMEAENNESISIQTGRLLVKKTEEHIEVFVHFGDLR